MATEIQIINKSKHALPQYATKLSAGMDLRANIDQPIVLRPLERTLVPTGLFMALPPGVEAQVRPRSGLALKHGITVLNTPGTIDADYRGELMVLLVNFSKNSLVPAYRLNLKSFRILYCKAVKPGQPTSHCPVALVCTVPHFCWFSTHS